jgi:hypothetical protein
MVGEGAAVTAEEFSEITQRHLMRYTVMLAIAQGESGRQVIVDNGTGMLLNTGTAEMLVTNAHVYDGFLKYREQDATTQLTMSGIDGTRFLDISEAKLLGKDRGCDIATLSIPRRYILGQGKDFAVVKSWPQRRAEKGMRAVLIGYPGQTRVALENMIGIRPLVYGMPIASSSNRHFVRKRLMIYIWNVNDRANLEDPRL